MRSFVDRLKAMQGQDGVLSLSLIHGFMAADVPEMGTQMLAIADGDRAKAEALARSLGMEVFALRGKTSMPMLGIEDGLDEALRLATAGTRQAGGRRRRLGQSRRRRRGRRHADPAPHAGARPRQFRGGDNLGPGRRHLLPRGGRGGDAAAPVRRQGGAGRRRADRRRGRGPQGDRRILAEFRRQPGHARRRGAGPPGRARRSRSSSTPTARRPSSPTSSPISASIRPGRTSCWSSRPIISTPASRRSRRASSISTPARPIPRIPGRRITASSRARSGRGSRIRMAAEGVNVHRAIPFAGPGSPLRPGALPTILWAGAARRPELAAPHQHEVFHVRL